MNFFKRFFSLFSTTKNNRNKTSEQDASEGVVKQFNHSRGFGFIYSKEYNSRIFLHITEVEDRPKVGQKVEFEVEETQKGLRATNVRLATN